MTTPTATLEHVLAAARARRPDVDTAPIVEAFGVAERAHAGQHRKSGHPYITHPLEVGLALAQWGQPAWLVAVGLLHDVPVEVDEHRRLIGDCVGPHGLRLVEALAVLDGDPAESMPRLQAQFAGEEPLGEQLILLKLADRLHNARTWDYVEPARVIAKARQTLGVLVPLAERAGLTDVTRELTIRAEAALQGRSQAGLTLEAGPQVSFAALRAPGVAAPTDAATRLLDRAIGILPTTHQARYRAEWAADLDATTGRQRRLLLTIGMIYSARRLRRNHRRDQFPRPTP